MRLRAISEFEPRPSGVWRAAVFGCALVAYAFDRDDVVWAIAPWHDAHQQLVARFIFAVAAVLVSLAEAGRTWARAYERADCAYEFDSRSGTWRADGPFRYVRNPLVLSDAMFVAGIGSLLSRTGLLVAILGIGLLDLWRANRCDRQVRHLRTDAYRELLNHVPRLLPSIHARIAARGSIAKWRQAFRAEAPGWACLLMLIAFSITLRDSVAWTIGGLALALAIFLNLPTSSPNAQDARQLSGEKP